MTEPLRILILEDNPADAELVQFELEEGGLIFTSKVVMTEEAFVRELQEYCPDLILSDYDLPRYNGALALVETRRRCPDTPFILVTGAVTEDRAIEILTQGAKDYVLKTRLQQRLVPAVRRALAEAEEHRARTKAEAELRNAYSTLEKQVKERTAELQESRERLRLALTSCEMGAFEWDIANDRRYFDDQVYLMLGIKPEDFSGTTEAFFRIIHPDDRQAVQEALKRATEQDKPYETEYRAIWPDGSTHHITARGKVQRDSAGSPMRMIGVCWEITESKGMEKVLAFLAQTSSSPTDEPFFNTLARYLAESLKMDFVCVDRLEGDGLMARTVAVWCDGHFEDNLTYALKDTPCGDVVGKTVCCFPASVRHFFPRDQVLQDLRAESYVGVTLFGQRGQPIGLIAVIGRRPLANRALAEAILKLVAVRAAGELERLDAEKALRESEEKFRALFESNLNGVALHEIVLDDLGNPVDYIFLEANPAFEKHTGLRVADILGKRATEEIPGIEKTALIQTYGKVALSGEPAIFEMFFEPLQRHYDISAYKVGEGRFAVVFEDITERKRMEKALKERSAQLEDTNRELESFSYSVSHDLKAPLRAIDGYFRMFLKKYGSTLDDDAGRMIDVIRDNAEKMGVLIDDLLSFSRVLKSSMTVSEIDMERLASEVWDDIRAANENRELDLKITKLLPGFGDRTLIKQVLSNLVSNAVKFTKNRTPGVIEISSYAEPDNHVYCVKDNGAGFDMDHYDRLFGVFQRLHGDDEYEGAGVGLAIVHRIVKRHGGRIWAEGKVGEGASFCFSLPGTSQE